MSTIIILAILIAICIFAIINSKKHFKGESGCCGGESVEKTEKTLNYIADKKKIFISGMHCKNCARKIESAINDVSYLACKVNLKENLAIVTGSQTINEEEIKNIIEKLGYKVVNKIQETK